MHPAQKIAPSLSELSDICKSCKKNGEVVVLTSGCFDLLHGGHLEYICEAGLLGYLIVGINSDKFVKKLKGDDRPIRTERDRAFTMAGFYPVQHVAIFDCNKELIKAVTPDIYVASSTSHVLLADDHERSDLLKLLGTEIVEIGSKKLDSTSDMIRRASSSGN